jgi:hypothetical protein
MVAFNYKTYFFIGWLINDLLFGFKVHSDDKPRNISHYLGSIIVIKYTSFMLSFKTIDIFDRETDIRWSFFEILEIFIGIFLSEKVIFL